MQIQLVLHKTRLFFRTLHYEAEFAKSDDSLLCPGK